LKPASFSPLQIYRAVSTSSSITKQRMLLIPLPSRRSQTDADRLSIVQQHVGTRLLFIAGHEQETR
jgi:hypothetical protein